jgi:hypothetical protein
MPCPVAITWTFVMSPTISNTGYDFQTQALGRARLPHWNFSCFAIGYRDRSRD